MLIGETSPYLSPLNGSLSLIDHSSPDELFDFQLELQPVNPSFGELSEGNTDRTEEVLINTEEQFSEVCFPHK
jgi:hypothetical protein